MTIKRGRNNSKSLFCLVRQLWLFGIMQAGSSFTLAEPQFCLCLLNCRVIVLICRGCFYLRKFTED